MVVGFLRGAGAILFITGVAKIWSALGNSKFLTLADPIIGITFGHLMLVVGFAEIVVAGMCFFSKRKVIVTALVAWFATNFAVYRTGIWLMDWKKPCHCLGNLTDAIHMPPQMADSILKGALLYMLVGSYLLLAWHWKSQNVLKQHASL